MLRLLALLLQLGCILAASDINLKAVVTSQPDGLSSGLVSGPSNELRDNDDDYDYSDNEQNDSVSFGSDINYTSFKHTTPASAPTPSASHAAHASHGSHAWQYLKRVPRHPQHLLNDNHIDGAAAFEDGYQSDQSDQPVGAQTAQKLRQVGTPEMVQFSRKAYVRQRNQTQNLRHMATEHRSRMEHEALCRWPQARFIYMRNETSKRYSPRGTILHRCDESTGCCPDSKVCTVKTKTTVELAFVVLLTGSKRANYELVALSNHTECECAELSAQRRKRSYQCQCPQHFSNFGWQRGGLSTSCRCDCHLSDATCQRLKNGEEGFAMSERRCILRNECSQPICNYGIYSSHTGRCPRPSQQQQQQRHRGYG